MASQAAIIQYILGKSLVSSGDIGRRATAARRCATVLKQQEAFLSESLTATDRNHLREAIELLHTIAHAASAAKRAKASAEKERALRDKAARAALAAAFSDVIDVPGVVALLAMTHSYRIRMEQPLTAFAAKDIMRFDRSDALEMLPFDRPAQEVRAKFDAVRPMLESKHAAFIAELSALLP